ncbi:hypothetical protein ESB00_00265 [Oleiharenicola lentus]|jgi:hypothetical protein|uniref:Beta/gamma crystallin 'Greek key' domain-containing protein n=1 Tax=Oleiharenicola lentus TaxID=2508720 RepID=A0A4Q1C668_9BACT|nr:hypothetical protein [Oleiharenicola lentus]RXK54367.1 hypothetical protein ESB00_00265 [Oleiharenicola lentus]
MKPRLLFLLTALVATALADRPGDGYDGREDDRRRPAGRVIIYQHANFRGDSLVLYPGEAIDNLSGRTFDNGSKLNDSISSIRVEGDVEVFAYENSRYRGEALRLTENTRDLTGRPVAGGVGVSWNDRISSLRVERIRGNRPGHGQPGPGQPGGARPPTNPDKLVQDTFQDLLGRAPDAGELREFRNRIIDAGWTERMLRDHLRREDRYRNEAAEAIVRRAYRDVLGREVDPAGLRQYTWAVRDKGWTESDVKDDLRKSAEYRNKPRN